MLGVDPLIATEEDKEEAEGTGAEGTEAEGTGASLGKRDAGELDSEENCKKIKLDP